MATTLTLYNQVSEMLANGAVDLDGATVKLALVTSGYAFNAEHDEWADASASEVSDASYAAGGVALTGKALTRSGGQTKFDADDVTFPALSATFRRGLLYVSGSAFGKTNPLLAAVLFDDTPGDVTVAGVNFRVQWHANGILTVGS